MKIEGMPQYDILFFANGTYVGVTIERDRIPHGDFDGGCFLDSENREVVRIKGSVCDTDSVAKEKFFSIADKDGKTYKLLPEL